ncbi:hypothetical protein ACOT81_26520 [Streptomyces sp. WI04-05B]|nr:MULTISPECIES: hypothetical protein [Streptomyces]MDX2545211.1 hypothetical protein [Streptomyces sp. WI04-05B]MDX2587325.1 hypothetical protein [Streptomyces sp. WI04-05A]MDX3493077.1 hypothetical protein [Streptomyces turgidiscabies]MDX3750944.1 hypothetical protein [Streptomyces sp. AK08-02]GAQ77260.1 hypothetical protein T45_09077 [Streptomyces turgidiscabies]
MADAPKINDVRLGDDGVLEFYDGTAWVLYPDVPDDDGPPQALTKDSPTVKDWPQ